MNFPPSNTILHFRENADLITLLFALNLQKDIFITVFIMFTPIMVGQAHHLTEQIRIPLAFSNAPCKSIKPVKLV